MATTARPSAPGRITQASEVQQLLELIRQRNIEVVDVKFCDLPGTWQHFSIPAATLDEDETFTTLELKINFLKPVRTGPLVATGHVVKGGRSIGLVECDVVDDKERLVARASSTCMTLRGEQAAGR